MSGSHLVKIVHRTHSHDAEPVTFQTHRLVIRPREGHDLRVESLIEASGDRRALCQRLS